MYIDDFIIAVFCLVDDLSKKTPVQRERGPRPMLRDSEVLTMELVGEFLGMDTDKRIWEYYSSHWRDFFPFVGK